MARNRIIKPEFWSSETLSKLSLESNLFFIGLWNFADDYGVLLDSNRRFLGDIYPHRENIIAKNIEKWKQELINAKLVVPHQDKSKNLLIIANWFEHQKVANPSKRKYLENCWQNEIEEIIKHYFDTNESLIRPKCCKEKEKEKEKGNEKETKKKFGEFVFLTDSEHANLISKLGKSETLLFIEKLDNYIGSKGTKYKSHYRTILMWYDRNKADQSSKQKRNIYDDGRPAAF